jgi:OmcA/MtrC family decaheme c-type cytochrome
LDNASTLLGNITKLDKLYLNGSGNVLTGAVTTDVTKIFDKLVTYDWWKTHRVGMEFNSGPKATAVPNKFNAIKDWVPLADTTRKAETRNIVSMNTCASCHNGIKIHKGYTTEYCVTCHNANTYDPTSGVSGSLIGTKPVDLQVIVHKLHMGKLLPSVIAGGTYKISSADYSAVNYPGVISNCAACHTATATKANGTTLLENAANWYTVPTKAACAGCHDGAATLAHIDAQTTTSGVQTCITCHGPNSTIGVDVKTVHGQK